MPGFIQSGRFGGAAFNPINLSNLVLWLDASDAASITSSAGAVSQWNDKSGAAHNATSTGTAQPTTGANTQNGLNVIKFDGIDDYMDLGVELIKQDNLTIACVTKVSAQYGGIITSKDAGVDTTPALSVDVSGTIEMVASYPNVAATAAAVSAYSVIVGKLATRQPSIYVDGGSAVTGTAPASYGTSATVDRLGSYRGENSNFGQVWLAEIVVYQQALTDADRISIRDYLKTKWGTP